MKVLVLGGTQFVGHAVVAEAVARGHEVTVANRGLSDSPYDGVRAITLDRTQPGAFDVLGGERFDLVVDTWSAAPSVVRDAARALRDQVDRWVYVSSRSVYAWPPPMNGDESAPLVDGDPDADATEYPADKRGAELALERELGADRVAHLRAGLILGPRENVGRLPWWLRRIAAGGRVIAPGRPGLGFQYVDARDLAILALLAGEQGRSGPVDVVCPQGLATMGEVLDLCREVTASDAELVWIDGGFLVEHEVAPWTELPIWLPEDDEAYALHSCDVSRAVAWGLPTRPLRETVADAWAWVQRVDAGLETPQPAPRAGTGLDPAKEAAVLAAWDAR